MGVENIDTINDHLELETGDDLIELDGDIEVDVSDLDEVVTDLPDELEDSGWDDPVAELLKEEDDDF